MVKKQQRVAGQQAAHNIHFRDEYIDEMMTNVAQYEKHVHLQKTNIAKMAAAAKAGFEEGCSDDDIYTVERIVDKKKVCTKTHYLVKWEGYSSDQNTWEPL